jgi:hypothetical protein
MGLPQIAGSLADHAEVTGDADRLRRSPTLRWRWIVRWFQRTAGNSTATWYKPAMPPRGFQTVTPGPGAPKI